jgi:hypothetical protein
MTRAQMEAARERVRVVINRLFGRATLDKLPLQEQNTVVGAFVTAVLGHPDGRLPRAPAGAGRKARRFAR